MYTLEEQKFIKEAEDLKKNIFEERLTTSFVEGLKNMSKKTITFFDLDKLFREIDWTYRGQNVSSLEGRLSNMRIEILYKIKYILEKRKDIESQYTKETITLIGEDWGKIIEIFPDLYKR
jgi:hypothetical protein